MINRIKERLSIMKTTSKKGFTLIELVVVIAIMAILALIMVPSLTAYIEKANTSKVQANLKNIHTASEMVQQTEGSLEPGKIAGYANLEAADFSDTVVKDKYTVKVEDGKVKVSTISKDNTHTFNGVEFTNSADPVAED